MMNNIKVSVLMVMVFALAACGASSNGDTKVIATPVVKNTNLPFEDSLDDITLDDGTADLDKIARTLDMHAASTDEIPNYAKQLDSIQWGDIDQALAEIQAQL